MGFFMRTDVLIVGYGLAGWAMADSLEKSNKSFIVFDSPQAASSSRAATGIYNPTVLKRFRAIDHAQALMNHSIPVYKQPKHNTTQHSATIFRILSSAAEQNDWVVAADKPELTPFLLPKINAVENCHIDAPYGAGTVLHTGWVDIPSLLDSSRGDLIARNRLKKEHVDYTSLKVTTAGVQYKDIEASYVVFTEGVGLRSNPWFSSLPLIPNKGEWLVISCPGLNITNILKGSVFVVPLGDDMYRIGATYSRNFSSVHPTTAARTWLEEQLKKYIRLPYIVLSHGAGLRPTVPDRKPLIGRHPVHPVLTCINGLGSRGVLWAPYAASLLTNCLFREAIIPKALNLRRFMPDN